MTPPIPILYLAPWVGYGGSDKNTIDWFRWIDRDRFIPTLIATQPSPNPLLDQVEPYADEVWVLPDLMPAEAMPAFIFDFLRSRDVRVIHLMNSRLGFDLLPDLSCLPKPPSVVVQMHAEETDRSGYVRYVATRYGSQVDCFSLSNEHVAKAVREYGVPAERTEVIYTGIDAEGEFSPELAQPIEELPRDRLQILFGARLVAQKDPLLMVEVAAALRDLGTRFQIHVVGEGDLQGQVEARIAALDLGDHVILHPPTAGLLSWYAACDVLLLTSTFEGVPVVIFEAMAMGLPIVTPGLPAIRELLDDDDEGVVLPRDSVQGYVEPLSHLAGDREHLAARRREMRSRAREQFSVQQMAADHGRLYERLVAAQGAAHAGDGDASDPVPARLDSPAMAMVSTDPSVVGDRGLCEKVLRRFRGAGENLDAIVLADAGPQGRFSFRALPREDSPSELAPHTVLWRRGAEQDLPQGLWADPRAPVASIVRLLSGAGAQVEWRHLPARPGAGQPGSSPPQEWSPLPPSGDGAPLRFPPESVPVPRGGGYRVPRWDLTPTWVPPSSTPAIRYRERDGDRRLLAGAEPPALGFEREHVLGALRSTAFQGTARLLRSEDGYRAVSAEGSEPDDGARGIGYIELAPLPGMDPLALALHRASGRQVVVCPADDPLLPEVDLIEHLGFLDPCPLKPRETPTARRPLGVVGLVKAVDEDSRRHRYAIGGLPRGELAAELGGLAESSLQGSIAAEILDGYLVTERHRPAPARPALREAARWALAPIGWRGLASRGARAKVAARRAAIAAARLLRASRDNEPSGEAAGWLFEQARPGLVPLFAAYHPVTGDQLLVRNEESAALLGYRDSELLGYLHAEATVTGELGEKTVPIPWARRFGHVPRPG
jgi:glycosyltransferase involved in cell wall biosynthesis